jgi:PIN domain
MLYVLADTDVWLDLAKDLKGQKVIAAIRELHHETRLTLLVSQLLLDEFKRNRSRVEADLTRSMSETVRLVRKEIVQHGQDDREAALAEPDNLTQGIPLLKQSAARNFDEVQEMLVNGRWLTSTPEHLETAAEWGLEKRAPFHQNRNSVADALHLLVYASAIDDPPGGPDDRFCFVTKNVKDFSAVGQDQRLPHPDIADLFSGLCPITTSISAWRLLHTSQASTTICSRSSTSTRSRAATRKSVRPKRSSSTASGTNVRSTASTVTMQTLRRLDASPNRVALRSRPDTEPRPLVLTPTSSGG